MINRILFALVALVACGATIAQQTTCKEYQASYWVFETSWMSSPAAACSALAGKSQKMGDTTYTISSAALNGQGHCALKLRSVYPQPTPPATSDESAAIADRTKQGPCGQEQCQSQIGQKTIVNWTVGYTRSPDIDVDPNWTVVGAPTPLPDNKLICDPSQPCALSAGAGVMPWQSKAPTASGLYRLSLDIEATYTGEACIPTDADKASLGKDAPIPPCPGFVGEINGVPGCYGTAENPTRNDKPYPKPMPAQAANPAAGKKPSTGAGSGNTGAGRTPATGNGGPAGGPSGAAGPNSGGTEPDGTTDQPDDGKEQQECGAPGQPPCRIDETGTPKGDAERDKLGGLSDAIKKSGEDTDRAIEEAKKLNSDGWTFTFQFPTGCAPMQLANLGAVIDPCRWQSTIHDLMSVIWLAVTIWCCVGMVGRTLHT